MQVDAQLNPGEISLHDSAVGDSVLHVSSPYGVLCPQTFLHSITRGFVSRLFQWDGASLIAIDARSLPGCEGAPVFFDRSLTGVRRLRVCFFR